MNLSDVHRGVHKNRAAQAAGPRHRLGPGQDGRPRSQGPVVAQRRVVSRRSSKAVRCRSCAAFPSAVSTTAGPRRVLVVNVGDLNEAFKSGDEVTPETLAAANLVKGTVRRVEDPRQRRSDEEAEDFRASVQQIGHRENRQGRRRSDRPARQGAGRQRTRCSKKKASSGSGLTE